jgi:PEP-CTERM motif-containing protein
MTDGNGGWGVSAFKPMAAGIVAGSAMALTAGAAMADGLASWSYAQVGVGSCDVSSCTATHPPVYITKPIDQGYNHNASISATDATRGSASASIDLGDFPSLPELHSISSGAPTADGANSWNFGFVEGSVGFLWTGPTMTIPLDTFVGTLEFSNTGSGFGYANGSLAFVSNAVEDPAIGLLWSADNGNGGFSATCSTPGAESILTTGVVSTKGADVTAVTNHLCASPTVNLVHDQDFYIWSRLETFVAGNEVSDASGTFSIDFKEGTSPELERFLAANVAPVGSIPEPSSWALMLLGFGALGAGLRSRRRAVALG